MITGPLFRVSFLFIMYAGFFMVFLVGFVSMVFLVALVRHFPLFDFFWFVSVNGSTKG